MQGRQLNVKEKLNMKKNCLLFLTILPVLSAFAKPAPPPKWFDDPREAFPESEYIVQKASGKTSEESKANAVSAMSRYFKTTVDGSLSTQFTSRTSPNGAEENTNVLEEITVESHNDFFALEYAEPYYHKPEKKWYCIAYINRERAWYQYKPELEIYKNTFNALYHNMCKETDFLTKLKMCNKVLENGTEFLGKLEYGRIINPEEESKYQVEREKIANIPIIYEETKAKCSVYINSSSDYNSIITTAVSKVLSTNGLKICKQENEAAYVVNINIDDCINGNDPISIQPIISLSFINADGKNTISYEIEAEEQSLSYTLEGARKKAYQNLAKQIQRKIGE